MARACRISCGSQCILDYDGNQYHVVLENISHDGALLGINRQDLRYIATNDVCSLMLCDNPELCPPKYSCRVVRFSTNEEKIGIQFLEHTEEE
jgi:hypothetical protein